mmetsp:Transcript_18073/g.54420  ORF Transcript_18073/g.54420 Transcript_18073/m.54420 type:complete len:226 (-) Transcript_18073:1437-2114(-)
MGGLYCCCCCCCGGGCCCCMGGPGYPPPAGILPGGPGSCCPGGPGSPCCCCCCMFAFIIGGAPYCAWGAKPLLMGRGPPICMPYPPAAGCCGCCCCVCGWISVSCPRRAVGQCLLGGEGWRGGGGDGSVRAAQPGMPSGLPVLGDARGRALAITCRGALLTAGGASSAACSSRRGGRGSPPAVWSAGCGSPQRAALDSGPSSPSLKAWRRRCCWDRLSLTGDCSG